MEDTIDKRLVLSDSDEDIDFTARKKHGKQALRIDESDSEVENVIRPQDPVETNGNISEEDSNESKDSSDDGEEITFSAQRKKKKRKKKSDEQVTDEVMIISSNLWLVNINLCFYPAYVKDQFIV